MLSKSRFLPIITLFLISNCCNAQKGKDGTATYNSGVNILNRYTTPVASISTGAKVFTVTNIADLNGSTSFTNSVNPYHTDLVGFGDILMLIQVQGADIDTSDNASYGTVTSLNNTGNYELVQVLYVSGNQINLCYGTARSYNQSGRSKTEVIRVPRLTTLSVGASATITGRSWNGVIGGVVALETNSTLTINGNVSADTLGFRGGTDVNLTSAPNLNKSVNFYRRQLKDSSAGKGESIAGDSLSYISLGGADGRGAPANGGGGGNGHNTGGGAGSNAGFNNFLTPYNGSGIKDTTGNWDSAWNLEAPNFALDSSVGGGRGGYSYGAVDRNAMVDGPGLAVWMADARHNVGGWGGHPLDYSGNNVLFMGGGGGSGDGNNTQAGFGGRGGGIIFLLSNSSVTGSGVIHANGQDGHSTPSAVYGNDAAGGAGGGGAIKVFAYGNITNVAVNANGGKGGSQRLNSYESEGPGGGGGGGYIGLSANTSISESVSGGANGITTSYSLTEFTANGATIGAPGTIASLVFADYAPACATLPITLSNFNAVKNGNTVSLSWNTSANINFDHFIIERSNNGSSNWNNISVKKVADYSIANQYTTDDKNPLDGNNYYRLMMVDKDGQFTYSDVVRINFTSNQSIRIYPNPLQGNNVYVESKNNISRLQVINSAGQILIDKKDVGNKLMLSLPSMAPGFYQVKTISNGETITTKLIKEN